LVENLGTKFVEENQLNLVMISVFFNGKFSAIQGFFSQFFFPNILPFVKK